MYRDFVIVEALVLASKQGSQILHYVNQNPNVP